MLTPGCQGITVWVTAAGWSEQGTSCAYVFMRRSGFHLEVNWPLTVLKQASVSKRPQLWQAGISCGERGLNMSEEGLQGFGFEGL